MRLAAALIPSMARIDAALMDAAPGLKLIVQFGAGLEGVDLEAARARGIAVRNVPGENAQAVAELALFLMLALARRLPEHRRSFEARVVGDPAGTELSGRTLGIVGLGASGRALARLARGIGMRVVAIARRPGPDPELAWVGGPPDLPVLLTAPYFVEALGRAQDAWRRIVATAAAAGIPAPAFSSSLAYYDGLRAERLPAALVQGQRDFFGAHTYQRTDKPGTFHTLWSGDRTEIEAEDTH